MIKKLEEKRGATLIFALGVLLVTTLISITIVSAALASAKTSARRKQNYQADLAISSAASYVKKLFDGCSYSYNPAALEGEDEYIVGYTQADGTESELGKLVEKDPTFEEEFKAFISGDEGEMTWNILSSVEGEKDPLKVTINAQNVDKNINIKLSYSNNDDENIDRAVYMIFTCSAVKNEIDTYDYTWSGYQIDFTGEEDSE